MENSSTSSGERAPHPLKGAKVAREGRNPNVHGEIPGSPVGSSWPSRWKCSVAGVHAPMRWGIHGTKEDGAFSVVLSGGYEDDEDCGETITYTGHGGRATKSKGWDGPQVADQEWVRGNNALKISCETKKPVRVIRGSGVHSQYAPAEGFRYDGLYVVNEAWRAVGVTGFNTCRFRLTRLPNQPPLPRRPSIVLAGMEDLIMPLLESRVRARASAEAGPSGLPFASPSPLALLKEAAAATLRRRKAQSNTNTSPPCPIRAGSRAAKPLQLGRARENASSRSRKLKPTVEVISDDDDDDENVVKEPTPPWWKLPEALIVSDDDDDDYSVAKETGITSEDEERDATDDGGMVGKTKLARQRKRVVEEPSSDDDDDDDDDVGGVVRKPKIALRTPLSLKRPREALGSSDDSEDDGVVKKPRIADDHVTSRAWFYDLTDGWVENRTELGVEN